MFIVDPPTDWVTPAKAVTGVRELGLASPNAISYFPRMFRRTDENSAPRAVGGALAGLMCKLDRTYGPWQALDQQGMGFSRELIAAFDIDEDDTQTLSREGFNLIVTGPAGRARLRGSVTMGRGSESHRKFASLAVRRLCLQIVNSIDQATRWAVYEPDETPVAERIRSLVTAYLSALEGMGAFESDRFVVVCDDDLCRRDTRQEHGVTILIGFHPLGCKEPVSFTLHQTVAGCRMASSAFAPVMENCA